MLGVGIGAGTGATSIVAGPANGIAIRAGVVGVAAGLGAAMLGELASTMVASSTDGGLGSTATEMIGGGPRVGAGSIGGGAGGMEAGECWRHEGSAGGMRAMLAAWGAGAGCTGAGVCDTLVFFLRWVLDLDYNGRAAKP